MADLIYNSQGRVLDVGGGGGGEESYKNETLAISALKTFGITSDLHLNDMHSMMPLVHITDLHSDWTRTSRAFDFAQKMNATLVCTGDILINTSTNDITPYMSILAEHSSVPYVHCVGNHDVWAFSHRQAFEKFIKPFVERGAEWTIPNGYVNPTFFYWDNEEWKIRFISVDQWRMLDATDADSTSHTSASYTQTQINFVISTLQSVPSGYGVIILAHAPEMTLTKNTTYPKFFADKLADYKVLMKPLALLVDAFISKTTINTSVSSSQETISLSADFSNVQSNEFICFISGHTHSDGITYLSNTTNKLLFLDCTCTNPTYNTSGNAMAEVSDLARTQSGLLQDAFNFYCIDRRNKAIKVVRIGSDMPYNLAEKRDCMVIPYV